MIIGQFDWCACGGRELKIGRFVAGFQVRRWRLQLGLERESARQRQGHCGEGWFSHDVLRPPERIME
jgi:hypothetical protein